MGNRNIGRAKCQCCGMTAKFRVTMLNLPSRFAGNPETLMCGPCLEDHEAQAQEVNDHEMSEFGGAYGLCQYAVDVLSTPGRG